MVVILAVVSQSLRADTNSGVEGFVERLYTIALKRDSEPEGKAFWVQQLKDKTMTGAEVAHGFFFSKEFIDADLSNGEYVTRLYQTFMDRQPEEEGFDFWTAGLFNGSLTRESTFQGFVESEEWHSICKEYGIVPGSRSEVKYFVYHLYYTALDRFGDEEGVNYWTDQLYQKKMSGIDVAFAFFNSPEYLTLDIDDERFIRLTYCLFFDNREADDEGFNYWLNKLQTGTTRAELFYGFAYSDEYAETCLKYGIKASFTAQPKSSGNKSTPAPTQAPVKEIWNQAEIEKAAKEQGLVWYDIECVGYKDKDGKFVFDPSKVHYLSDDYTFNEQTGEYVHNITGEVLEDPGDLVYVDSDGSIYSKTILDPGACYGTVRVYGKFVDFSSEKVFLTKMSDYRVSVGSSALTITDNKDLIEYCKLRAAETSVYFSHRRPIGQNFGFTPLNKWASLGEIASAGHNAESVENSLFEGYKKSEGHRLNMIDPIFYYCYSATFIKYEWNGTTFIEGTGYNVTQTYEHNQSS